MNFAYLENCRHPWGCGGPADRSGAGNTATALTLTVEATTVKANPSRAISGNGVNTFARAIDASFHVESGGFSAPAFSVRHV